MTITLGTVIAICITIVAVYAINAYVRCNSWSSWAGAKRPSFPFRRETSKQRYWQIVNSML
jgi:hypothetical protein